MIIESIWVLYDFILVWSIKNVWFIMEIIRFMVRLFVGIYWYNDEFGKLIELKIYVF